MSFDANIMNGGVVSTIRFIFLSKDTYHIIVSQYSIDKTLR